MWRGRRRETRMQTELSERLGIRHPIMQSGMGTVGELNQAPLAAALTNAGGLGQIAHPSLFFEDSTLLESEAGVRRTTEEVIECVLSGLHAAARLTDGPLGFNVRVARRQPDAKPLIEAVLDERKRDRKLGEQVTVITTSAGHPDTFGLNERIRDEGLLHFHAASTARQARNIEAAGLDGVIATGYEAAGHLGKEAVHTMVLVPAVRNAVDIPVLAAGGIADGRGLAAALCLGADMVYMGTRFLASVECEYHANTKQAVADAVETATVVEDGWVAPARQLRNAGTDHIAEMRKQGATLAEINDFKGRALRKGVIEGDIVDGRISAGMSSGIIDEVLPVAQIVENIMAEAEAAADRLAGFRARGHAATP